jgi:hypothetical protein
MHKSALVAAVMLVSTMAAPAFSEGAFPSSMQESDPRELRLAAFQKYLEGDLPGASDLYRRAIQAGEAAYGKDSTFVADICYEVGTIALEDGQFQNAETYLKKAVSKKPNSVMARVKYADLLTMRGNTNDAFAQIQEALKVSPGSPIAQQAMVKFMMSQASHRTAEGAIANVAATWECFNLRNMGQSSVAATMANISNWRNSFLKPKTKAQPKPKPVVASAAPPKVEIKEIVKPKPKPPQTVPNKPKVAKSKTVEKPVVAAKKEPPAVRVSKPKPVETPQIVAVSAPSKKSKNGLVPPPPPGPVFNAGFGMMPPPPSGFILETKASITKPPAEKPKEKKKPKPSASSSTSDTAEEDPSYLLDWASDGKKGK